MTSRTWVFTINNYTDEDLTMFENWQSDVKRLVVSKEIGESGTPHLQGAVTFNRAYRLTGLKKLHTRAHWEKALTTDPTVYCVKEGSEVVINVNNQRQGSRTDLETIRTQLTEGADPMEIATENFSQWVQYGRRFDDYRRLLRTQQVKDWNQPRDVIVLWGTTGTGKTRSAMEHKPTLVEYDGKFHGYDGQPVVLFDDFDWRNMPRSIFLRLTDRYPYTLRVMYGTEPWLAGTIYITSNDNPADWYRGDPAVQRRLTYVHHLQPCVEPPAGVAPQGPKSTGALPPVDEVRPSFLSD